MSLLLLLSLGFRLWFSTVSTKPGHMAKKAEKAKFDRYPHISMVPFIRETTQAGLAHMPGNSSTS